MQAQLRAIHSPDVKDLLHYMPEDFDNFCIPNQTLIGPVNGKGEESFNFLVCTPKWIEQELKKDRFLFGKGLIVIEHYNFELLHKILEDLCHRTSGEDWHTIAIKLNRFGNWEFEDYR